MTSIIRTLGVVQTWKQFWKRSGKSSSGARIMCNICLWNCLDGFRTLQREKTRSLWWQRTTNVCNAPWKCYEMFINRIRSCINLRGKEQAGLVQTTAETLWLKKSTKRIRSWSRICKKSWGRWSSQCGCTSTELSEENWERAGWFIRSLN